MREKRVRFMKMVKRKARGKERSETKTPRGRMGEQRERERVGLRM
jgi:hypothetical protein